MASDWVKRSRGPRRLAWLGLLPVVLVWASESGAAVLASDLVVAGLNSDGSLVTDDSSVGLLYDPDGAVGSLPMGQDILLPGTAWEVWSVSYSAGAPFLQVSGGPALPGGAFFEWQEPRDNGFVASIVGEAVVGALSVRARFDLPYGYPVLWITLELTAAEAVTDLWLARTVDADQDAMFDTYETVNEAGDGVAVAGSRYVGRAVALAVDGGEGGVCTGWCTRPSDVVAAGTELVEADRVIGVAVGLGSLAAAETRSVTFAYAFAPEADEAWDLALAASIDADHDRDGVEPEGGDCDDADPRVFAGAVERPDGLDNDCDGTTDEQTSASDDDDDGFTEAAGDCDDGDERVYPGAAPVSGIDDADCDGETDDGSWPSDGGPPDGWGEDDGGGADGDADRDGDGAPVDGDGEGGSDLDGGGGMRGSAQGCGCAAADRGAPEAGLALVLGVVAALLRRRSGGRA